MTSQERIDQAEAEITRSLETHSAAVALVRSLAAELYRAEAEKEELSDALHIAYLTASEARILAAIESAAAIEAAADIDAVEEGEKYEAKVAAEAQAAHMARIAAMHGEDDKDED